MKPRILMVTGEYPPEAGGVADYTALLNSHLVELGAEITVFTSRLGTRSSSQDASSLMKGESLAAKRPGSEAFAPVQSTLVPIIRWNHPWGFSAWSAILSAAEGHRAQVVHLQYQAAAYGMHLFANLLPGYIRLRLRGIKTVTTFHDLRVPYLFPKAGPLRTLAIRALDLLSHATVLTNQTDLEKLIGLRSSAIGLNHRRWLIPISSNLKCAPPADYNRTIQRGLWCTKEDSLLLSYFGFMNDSKGLAFLLLALEQLVARGLDARLLVIGGETGEVDPTNRGYSQKVRQCIASRRLEERICWPGFLPPSEVSAALLSSDLCVLPFRDGASLRRGSLLAAIVHGLPVVTTLPEYPEALFINGENMVMVPRDCPSAIADAVELLWRNPSARSRLARGAKLLAERFQWPDIARRHMEMYDTLLSR